MWPMDVVEEAKRARSLSDSNFIFTIGLISSPIFSLFLIFCVVYIDFVMETVFLWLLLFRRQVFLDCPGPQLFLQPLSLCLV